MLLYAMSSNYFSLFLLTIIFLHDIKLSFTLRDSDSNRRKSLWSQEDKLESEENQLKNNANTNLHKTQSTCNKKFIKREGQIIQTQKSVKNGAVFLSVSPINTAAKCTNLCCNLNSCTTAVFEINKHLCYLFDCSKHDICSYSKNANYVASTIQFSPGSSHSSNKHLIDHEDEEAKAEVSKATSAKHNSVLTQESHPRLSMQSHHHHHNEAYPAGGTALKDEQKDVADEERRFDSKSRPITSSDKLDENEAVLNVAKGSQKKKIKSMSTALPTVEEEKKLRPPVATAAAVALNMVKSNWQQPAEKIEGLSAEDLRMLANTNSQSRVAIVALGLSLALTGLLLTVVAFRLRSVRSRLRRGGKVLNKDEADYLINGMYL